MNPITLELANIRLKNCLDIRNLKVNNHRIKISIMDWVFLGKREKVLRCWRPLIPFVDRDLGLLPKMLEWPVSDPLRIRVGVALVIIYELEASRTKFSM